MTTLVDCDALGSLLVALSVGDVDDADVETIRVEIRQCGCDPDIAYLLGVHVSQAWYAIGHRLAGDIAKAIVCEGYAEDAYRRLPKGWRW